MKVLNLLASGGVGGIEVLCENIGKYAQYDNLFCFLFAEGKVYEEMKLQKMNAISLAYDGDKKISLKRAVHLLRIARDCDIVVVHHSSIAVQFYYFLIKKCSICKKYVLTVHSCFEPSCYFNYKSKWKRKLREKFLNIVLKISDKIVFVSEAGKRSYEKEFCFPEEKATVIYNGTDVERLEEQREKAIYRPEKKIRLTYIGRLVEVKGVHLLIKAIYALKNQGVHVSLTIVGDGEYRTVLEKEASELGVADSILFEGIQRDIGEYLNRTDIFVYPSICEEVFGIALVEAMAFGIPCVANPVGGIPEILLDGYNGFLAKEKTAEGIEVAIKRVIRSYENGNIGQLKKNCINTAWKFDIHKTVFQLEIFYPELLQNETKRGEKQKLWKQESE